MTRSVLLMTFAAVLLAFLGGAARAQPGRKSVSASEVNGTYRMNFRGKFRDASNEIKLLALGRGRVRVAMELMYPFIVNGELSANLGELDGEALIKGDTAVYSSDEFGPCEITIKFVRPGTIKVTQSGDDFDCGFGHNVTSNGTYRKVSSKKPRFDQPGR